MRLERLKCASVPNVSMNEKVDRGLLREQILKAAQELIAEGVYESVTMRKVAERISRSPMSLYHHFAAKEELLTALARQVFASIGATLPKSGGDPVRTLHQAMLKYVKFGVEHPREYRLIFLTRRTEALEEPSERQVDSISNRAGGQDAFRRMLEYVDAGLAAGMLSGDRFTVSTVLWAGMHGCVSLLLTQGADFLGPPKQFAEATVATLLRGVGSPSSLCTATSASEES